MGYLICVILLHFFLAGSNEIPEFFVAEFLKLLIGTCSVVGSRYITETIITILKILDNMIKSSEILRNSENVKKIEEFKIYQSKVRNLYLSCNCFAVLFAMFVYIE